VDFDLLVPALIVVGIMLLVAFPIHEFAHAFAAYRLGDGTAKLFGRLTLNPVVHFDPLGGTLLAITVIASALSGSFFGFGWAKPTPVNPMNLRAGRWGEAIVAAAGPASNFVLAVAGALPLRYIIATQMDVPELFFNFLFLFVYINLILMVFNFLPIPPLDGSKVLFAFLDPMTERRIRPVLEQYGFLILLLAIFPLFGGQSLLGMVFGTVVDPIFRLLVGV
jgi:Zn-dependent protease